MVEVIAFVDARASETCSPRGRFGAADMCRQVLMKLDRYLVVCYLVVRLGAQRSATVSICFT